jgi:hypothetical protein
VVKNKEIKIISDHVPKHIKPLNDEQLGHYLAGLIDGDGHFSKIGQLIIVFSSKDAFLAYYLKEAIGFGNVKKVKNKNAHILVISSKKGIVKVINLVNGKLRLLSKFNQVINSIINNKLDHELKIKFTMNTSLDFNNH